MERNIIIDFIIELIRASKKGKKKTDKIIDCDGVKIKDADYLLNQLLRALVIDADHYFISNAALELWNKLTDKCITDFYYNEVIVCEKANGVKVKKYTGNKKEFREDSINAGGKIHFNDVFHLDHIVPISRIVKQLKELPDDKLTNENINEILSKIYICRMTKEEDRRIKEKSRRNGDYRVIYNMYKRYDIIIDCLEKEFEMDLLKKYNDAKKYLLKEEAYNEYECAQDGVELPIKNCPICGNLQFAKTKYGNYCFSCRRVFDEDDVVPCDTCGKLLYKPKCPRCDDCFERM